MSVDWTEPLTELAENMGNDGDPKEGCATEIAGGGRAGAGAGIPTGA